MLKYIVEIEISIKLHRYKTGIDIYAVQLKIEIANYAQTECQFRYCGTAIPFLTVRSTAR